MTHGNGTLEVAGEQFTVSYELSGDRGVFHSDRMTLANLLFHVGQEGVIHLVNGQSLSIQVGSGKVGTTGGYIKFTVQHYDP